MTLFLRSLNSFICSSDKETDSFELSLISVDLIFFSTFSTFTLAEDILCSHIVVGCESMAMVVALLADKLVISCIPPGGRACQLPHKEILDLKDMVFKQI